MLARMLLTISEGRAVKDADMTALQSKIEAIEVLERGSSSNELRSKVWW